jgi:hypothetical protein
MIFFPRLYMSRQARRVSQEDLQILYDDCIRPTVAHLSPASISHWPVSYSACMKRIRDTRGQYHFTSIDISPDYLEQFGTLLRQRLQTHANFQDSFFVHEWRGLKEFTSHNPAIPDDCDEALGAALEDIDMNGLYPPQRENEWFVDVGVEVNSPDKVLQWKADTHNRVLAYTVPTASLADLDIAMSRSSFHVDVSSHVYPLAGFRWEVPRSLQGLQAVQYVNVYTTDKSATYQLHRGAFRRHQASDLFPDKIGNLLKDIIMLSDIYDKCSGDEGQPAQYSNARLEVRMALRPNHINHKLRDVTRDFINCTIVGFDAGDWW